MRVEQRRERLKIVCINDRRTKERRIKESLYVSMKIELRRRGKGFITLYCDVIGWLMRISLVVNKKTTM